MAAALTCSTPFTPATQGTIPTAHNVCVLVCHFCVCAVCVYKRGREVGSVCLDLLVILAWLFRGSKKIKNK